jgi:hypothetical protein
MEVCNTLGYLESKIVFYLMNLHAQRRTIYFARAGKSKNASYKSDDSLTPEGFEYAKRLADRLISFREEEHATEIAQGGKPRSLIVPPSK